MILESDIIADRLDNNTKIWLADCVVHEIDKHLSFELGYFHYNLALQDYELFSKNRSLSIILPLPDPLVNLPEGMVFTRIQKMPIKKVTRLNG